MTKSLDEILSEIETRAESATPGPWKHRSYQSGTECVTIRQSERIQNDDYSDGTGYLTAHVDLINVAAFNEPEKNLQQERWRDADFIAHARTDVPKLLAVIRKLIEQRTDAMNYDYENSREIMDTEKTMDAELAKIWEGGE